VPAGTPQSKTSAKRTARTQRRRAGREGGLFGRETFHPHVTKQQIFFPTEAATATDNIVLNNGKQHHPHLAQN
jgi:hypothetical protein